MSESQYFISYARKDVVEVNELIQLLRLQGANLWIDEKNIGGGARWRKEIRKALNQCAGIIIFLSP